MTKITPQNSNRLEYTDKQHMDLCGFAHTNGYKACIVTIRGTDFVLNCDMVLVKTPSPEEYEKYDKVELPETLQF